SLPANAINARIQETFIKPAMLELPEAVKVPAWWMSKREDLLQGLREKVFRSWVANPPALSVRPAAEVTHDGLRLRAFDFVSEEKFDLRFWLLTATKVEKPNLVVLTAVDETGWQEWTQELGPPFKDALQLMAEPTLDAARFAQNRRTLEYNKW